MRRIVHLVILVGLMLLMPCLVESYDLSWWTVNGGGGQSTGGSYTLTGTAGQPDAGVISGGAYTLRGGFWNMGAVQSSNSYLLWTK